MRNNNNSISDKIAETRVYTHILALWLFNVSRNRVSAYAYLRFSVAGLVKRESEFGYVPAYNLRKKRTSAQQRKKKKKLRVSALNGFLFIQSRS